MQDQKLRSYGFDEATEAGEITNRDGYHQPRSGGRNAPRCGCSLTTDKGAYRDVTVEWGDVTIHFYHQSAVVVTDGRHYRLDSHGYKTATTKERINRYLPSGFKLVQRDYEWYLKCWDPAADYDDRDPTLQEFHDGMLIEA